MEVGLQLVDLGHLHALGSLRTRERWKGHCYRAERLARGSKAKQSPPAYLHLIIHRSISSKCLPIVDQVLTPQRLCPYVNRRILVSRCDSAAPISRARLTSSAKPATWTGRVLSRPIYFGSSRRSSAVSTSR